MAAQLLCVLSLCALSLGALGCVQPMAAPPVATPRPSATPQADLLNLSAEAPSRPGRMQGDPYWMHAKDSHLALAALAEREGASGLLEGVRLGGGVAIVALAALPLVPDAETGLGPLCDLLPRTEGESRTRLLTSLVALAEAVASDRERVAMEEISVCRTRLERLAGDRSQPASQRDLAAAGRVELDRLR